MSGSLKPVRINDKGVVKNILALNYTRQTTIKEYLNNVLDKNSHPEYSINFYTQMICCFTNTFMFECSEKNAEGFTSLDELRAAFSIADSTRTGTNNMGYGIYAPITINREHEAIAIFIQDNKQGRFYSAVHFDVGQSSISTIQGPLEEIEKHDIQMLMDDVTEGTKSIWITFPDKTDISGEPRTLSVGDIIKGIKRYYKWRDGKNSKDYEDIEDIYELGKYYYHYISNGTIITYGGKPIESINLLKGDGPNHQEKEIDISVVLNTGEYRIKDKDEVWCKFNKTHTPYGATAVRNSHTKVQFAKVKIVDIDKPDKSNKTRMIDRKIWVKINDTYIFCEDFPLRGWPNIRVVIELTNNGDNAFDAFISPDANKSNSKINPQIKDRVAQLVKHVINGEFIGRSEKVKISDTLKHKAWEMHIGDKINGECEKCDGAIKAWNYDVQIRPIDDSSDGGSDGSDEITANSLICLCKSCGKK